MEPQETQEDMSPEEAKASLGIATFLQDQVLQSQVPQEGMESEEEPKEDTSDLEAKLSKMMDKKLNAFKEDLLADLEDEEDKDTKDNTEA